MKDFNAFGISVKERKQEMWNFFEDSLFRAPGQCERLITTLVVVIVRLMQNFSYMW